MGVKLGLSDLWEEHKPRTFEERVPENYLDLGQGK